MRTGLRCAAILAAAIAISSTSPGEVTGVAVAGPCLRTVGIEPQVSAGEGGGTLTFAVFSEGCPLAGEVGYTTSAGSASEGKDFKAQSGVLHWNDGEIGGKTISVPIGQDLLREADLEDFWVRLIEPTPTLQIVKSAGQGRVLDDDGEALLWGIDDRACLAPMPDPRCLCQNIFQLMPYVPNCGRPPLHLSAPRQSPTIVHWRTLDGTAIAGLDYEPVPAGVQSVPAGLTDVELFVRLFPRPGAPKRHLYVQVTGVSHGRIADGLAVITIHGT